jgi:WD40 repeat protein
MELEYFSFIELDSSLYFGGKLGTSNGISCVGISPNGRIIAYALSNGHILVYDTNGFEMTRFFTGAKGNYTKIEVSRDNMSQIFLTDDAGNVRSFLMRGQVQYQEVENPYIDPKNKKFIFPESRPVMMIPFYELNYQHLLTSDNVSWKNNKTKFQINTATLHPSITFTGFQHNVLVGTKNGSIMKYNTNIGKEYI